MENLLDAVAPCGLLCSTCLANPKSPISSLSKKLKKELGGFGSMAERFAQMDPVFSGYKEFHKILERFARGSCGGCRTGHCLLQECRIKDCVIENQVDFCFQCPSVPCVRSNLKSPLKKRWIENNTRMREMGIDEYYRIMRSKPRYRNSAQELKKREDSVKTGRSWKADGSISRPFSLSKF